jgi:hypothetical protein
MATGRIGTTPVLQVRWSKAPSAGTTSLSGLDDNSVSLVYSVGYEAVYRNGVLLSRTNDYTATNGTTITLIDATIAGDIIEVFANQTIPLADTYSQTVANGKFINNTLTTTTGDIIYASAANTPARLGIGSTDQVLKVSGGIPAWGAAPAPGFTSIANGTLATGVSTTTISALGGYDTYLIFLYNTVTTADNKTYNITMNNTSTYYGVGARLDAYSDGSSPSGTSEGFRLEAANYVGTQTDAHHAILIQGGKSLDSKIFQYFFTSDYLDQIGQTYGYTNSTAALSSITITSNGTLNGGTYRILGA